MTMTTTTLGFQQLFQSVRLIALPVVDREAGRRHQKVMKHLVLEFRQAGVWLSARASE